MVEKNTAGSDEIRSYTLTELCKKDNTTIPTIKKGSIKDEYIKVRFENCRSKYQKKIGKQERGYAIKYIRVEDIKRIIEKRGGKLILKNQKTGWQKL